MADQLFAIVVIRKPVADAAEAKTFSDAIKAAAPPNPDITITAKLSGEINIA